jgi:hypothetical protein
VVVISLCLVGAVARAEVEALARGLGFIRDHDPPASDGRRETRWRRGDDLLIWIGDSSVGAAVVRMSGPGADRVARRMTGRFACATAEALLQAARRQLDLVQRIRNLGRIGLLFASQPRHLAAAALIAEALDAPHKALRWAAADAAERTQWPSLDEAVARAALRHPDLRPFAERWRARRLERIAACTPHPTLGVRPQEGHSLTRVH